MNIKHTHLLFDQHIQPEDPKLFHYNHQPFACQGSLGWDSQGSWTFHPLVRLLHTARDRKRVRSCLQKIGYLYPKLMFLSSGVKLVMFLCFQLTGNASVHVSRDNYESSRTPACSMMQSSSKLAQIGTFITYLEWRWCELWNSNLHEDMIVAVVFEIQATANLPKNISGPQWHSNLYGSS